MEQQTPVEDLHDVPRRNDDPAIKQSATFA